MFERSRRHRANLDELVNSHAELFLPPSRNLAFQMFPLDQSQELDRDGVGMRYGWFRLGSVVVPKYKSLYRDSAKRR